ncbi:YhgE/Pip domain-containing protein [Haloglycomyces albus]|uniref:YhgE/Pip domain-containing protein n=1 Tax=Haloglycomyces albus TaxID=526067 RepID=UPI00046D42C2|nr:YhgE/Pip domain-containing protein [Haloglycomyces albus]
MSSFKLAFLELRRFKGHPLRYAALIAIILMPLVYGGLYLAFSWDPYGKTDQVPVAVVNQDKGATVENSATQEEKAINAGDQLTSQLKETDLLGWNFVDEDQAMQGLKDGDYYVVITVPEDFSERLASLAGTNPERAEIQFTLNDANGYLAGVMAQTVELNIQQQINTAVYITAAKSLFSGLEELSSGLQEAADGASEIEDALGDANSGMDDIESALAQLEDGSQQVSDGVTEAVNKATPIISFATETWDGVTDIATTASDGVHDALSDMQAVRDDACETETEDENLAPVLEEMCTRAEDAINAAEGVQDDIDELESRIDARVDTDELQQALDDLEALDSGASDVADGIAETHTGATTLNDGLDDIEDGQSQLADELDSAAQRIPSTDPSKDAENADVIGNPTAIEETNLNPAGTYGRGMAPFFIAIALWVFGLICYLLLRPVNPRALLGTMRSVPIALGGWMSGAFLGLLSLLVLYVTLQMGLGLDPKYALGTIGFGVLVILVFSALTHLLKLAFGAAGSLLIVVLLMIQLTSAGGLYPPEVTPGFFRILHPLLPMSYVVDGFRVTISGGEMDHLLRACLVLVGYGLAAVTVSTLLVMRRRRMTMSQLKPHLEI